MLRKIHAKKLINQARVLDKSGLMNLKADVLDLLNKKGKVLLGISGSPGSGKSDLARIIASAGFLGIPENEIFLVDDLRDASGNRYTLKELKKTIEKINNRLVVIVDFRSAIYLRNLDFLIVLHINEKKRLENLKRRSLRSLERYGKARYAIPPISLKYKSIYLFETSKDWYLYESVYRSR